jgi:putative hydrolase
MRLLADLHVHTIASDGYCTVTELAIAARGRGLELIAITDHGPAAAPRGAELYYFRNQRVVASVIDGVRVLKGCEANIVPGTDNGLDLPDDHLARLDFVAVGFHPGTGFDVIDRVRNTEALLQVIENPYVDLIAHPGNDAQFPLELEAVVAAAARHRVALELNNHSFDDMTPRSKATERECEFASAAKAAGAPVAVGSDAHFANRVGVFDAAIAAAESLGFSEDEILNHSAESVLGFLTGKRERPYLEAGGEWSWREAVGLGENGAGDCGQDDPRGGGRDAAVLEALMRLKDGLRTGGAS